MFLTASYFSTYGVGYKAPLAYADTVNHWAKADIDFAASRGLLKGTVTTTFSPDNTMAVNTKIDGYAVGPDGARREV